MATVVSLPDTNATQGNLFNSIFKVFKIAILIMNAN